MELKSVATEKAVEFRRFGPGYKPDMLAPIDSLHVISARTVWTVGDRPIPIARYLVLEIPDWKARRENLTAEDAFPALSADDKLRARRAEGLRIETQAVNLSMRDYLVSIGYMKGQAA